MRLVDLEGFTTKYSVEARGEYYIDGNYQGPALSFKFKEAIMFGLIVKIGNLALVFKVRKIFISILTSEHGWTRTITGYGILAEVLCL